MIFSYPKDFKEKQIAPGVVLRLVWGERIMLSHVSIAPHSSVPTHSHPNEQTGIVLEGELELTIAGDTYFCKKGDAYTIADNVEHSVITGDKSAIVLDTFNPPRDDYK